LAVLASAGTAFAQSSVTLYGIADVWVGNLKTTAFNDVTGRVEGVGQTKVDSGGLSGSRWGLRGSEDLGGGLKAVFQLESGFDISGGSLQQGGNLFGRQAFVGLGGGFGTVTLGRQYPAYDEARGGTDALGHSSFSATAGNGAWGATGSVFNNGLGVVEQLDGRDYTFRLNNSIHYATPNLGGFNAAVTVGLGENKGANPTTNAASKAGNVLSLRAGYTNGPINVQVAHQNEKDRGVPGSQNSAPAGGVGSAFGTNVTSEKHTLLAGSYDLGVAKLFAGYNTSSDNTTVPNTGKDKEFSLGAAIPFGAARLEVGYGNSKTGSGVAGTDIKVNSLGLQAIYSLSKRSDAYFGLLNTKAKFGSREIGKVSLVAVGLRHRF
jgi:predicted porin